MSPPEDNRELSGAGESPRQLDIDLITALMTEQAPEISCSHPSSEVQVSGRPWLQLVPAPSIDEASRPQENSTKVIDLVKHFRAKQIRNYRRPRRTPGALVLLKVFHPDEPA